MALESDGEEVSTADGVEPGEASSIHVLSLQWFPEWPGKHVFTKRLLSLHFPANCILSL